VLRPGELVPAEDDAGLAQLGADEVASCVGHVGVADAEDERCFATEEVQPVEGVGAGRGRGGGRVRPRVWAERARVDVCWEVGDCCCYAGVELARRV
jgi:hypothetical protein